MKSIKDYIGEPIYLELMGKKELAGLLIDFGSDVLVLFKKMDFFYVPFRQIKEIKPLSKEEAAFLSPADTSSVIPFDEKLSLQEVLNAAAKGSFIEMNIAGSQPIFGYVVNVQDDYIVMFSPVYETILIPIHHIKWLVPYSADTQPYGFKHAAIPSSSTLKAFSPTFEEQLKKLKSSFIKCNIEGNESIGGQLLGKEDDVLTLMTAKENVVYLNIQHIKTIVPVSFKEK